MYGDGVGDWVSKNRQQTKGLEGSRAKIRRAQKNIQESGAVHMVKWRRGYWGRGSGSGAVGRSTGRRYEEREKRRWRS